MDTLKFSYLKLYSESLKLELLVVFVLIRHFCALLHLLIINNNLFF